MGYPWPAVCGLIAQLPRNTNPNVGAVLVVLSLIVGLCSDSLHAQRVLMEDFSYPPGDSLTPHGWTSSSATGPILTSAGGLDFGIYQGSGIGNAALLKSTGQDVQREFPPDTSGTFYIWALVNVGSARSGDYFMHLQPSAGSSVYVARTYVRLAVNGGLAFGVAKRGTNTAPTVVYSDSVYSLGTTVLLVVKYEFKSVSTSDDEVTLYVFHEGTVPRSEPVLPDAGPVSDATADPTAIGALALRQGDQARAPALAIDGLRLTRGWEAWLPATIDRMEAELSTEPRGTLLSWRAWTEVGVEGYRVDRWSSPDGAYLPVNGTLIPAVGAAGQPSEYRCLDASARAGLALYRLWLVESGGGEYLVDSISLDLPTAVDDEKGIHLSLTQNYPNPFNPSSLMRFVSPITQDISVNLYDVLGRRCASLFNGQAEAGRVYELALDGSTLSTGVYVVRMISETNVAVRKVIVVR